MSDQDQTTLLNALEQQARAQRKMNQILKIVLPITAFLISMICANFNWQSTLGTFVMLTIAFWAVAIRQWSLWIWLALTIVYSLVDNYFSYQHAFDFPHFKMQLSGMLPFLVIIHFARPYLDQMMLKKEA
ncbi:hypothetical protein [Acinetobacter sp. MD2(2019)]|uniref:hypothetical protein n=1 Tax=Acinetobacter sp. MD2(2019) TaxID=2605273 RepID=UPI002D1F26BD|nr:hypothetical protein [Acinetobacter sp. MD2(2019)]MEB3753292.1 hypothetical protein [Acinetobacter sp. MD2(2019)]